MKREFLKDLGLSDDQINSIMSAHGKDVNGLNEQINSLTAEKNGLQSQLNDRDEQLKGLKSQVKDSDELTAKINELEKANKAAKEKYAADLSAQQKSFLIDKALTSAGAHNNKAVSALLNLDDVTVKDGALDGLDKQLEALKESDGYLFKQSEEPKPQPKSGVQITGGQPKPTNAGAKIDFAHASYQEIKAFKDEHPQEYADLTNEGGTN